MLEIKDATIHVASRHEISALSFAARDGKMTAVTGRTGSGKTLLLETMLGLHRLDKGYVTIDGELLEPATAFFFRSRMAYVPQHLYVPGSVTVAEMYDMARCGCVPRAAFPSKDDVEAMWQRLHLDTSLWQADMAGLPQGVIKRVLLSLALLSRRKMVVADEPTGHLDDGDAAIVLSLLRAEAARGAVVLVATKDSRVEQMADVCVAL